MPPRILTRDEAHLAKRLDNWQSFQCADKKVRDDRHVVLERTAFLHGVNAALSKKHIAVVIETLEKQCQQAWEQCYIPRIEESVKLVREGFAQYTTLKRQLDAWKVLFEEIEE